MWCGASWGVVSRTRRARGGEGRAKTHARRAGFGFGEPGHLQNCSLDRRESEDEARDAMAPTWAGQHRRHGRWEDPAPLTPLACSYCIIACDAAAERHVLALCGCCLRGMCISERCSDCCVFKSDHLLSSASPGQSRTNERRESIRKTATLSLCKGKETACCSWQIYVVWSMPPQDMKQGSSTRSHANMLLRQHNLCRASLRPCERAPG